MVCLPKFDCFPRAGGEHLQNNPVLDCSKFEGTDLANTTLNGTVDVDVSYECHRFVYDYVGGIGAVGGVFAFTALVSTFYFGLLVSIRNGLASDDRFCRRGILYSMVITIAFGVFGIFFAFHLYLLLIRETVFPTDIIQFGVYSISFFFVVLSGIFVVLGMQK